MSRLIQDLVAEPLVRAHVDRWSLAPQRFTAALRRSVEHRFGTTDAPDAALRAYLGTLHAEDLALACACRDGNEQAWAHFMSEVLPHVRTAARAIAGADGDELVDSLIGDLYGTRSRAGERQSLLDYFHGRSRLVTWLRVVLAQRHVDTHRSRRKVVSLDVPEEQVAESSARAGSPVSHGALREIETASTWRADRPKLMATFAREFELAISALSANDRLRLTLYYLHGLTLAHIGRLMHEHESSASRKLERTRQHLRKRLEDVLRQGHGFTDADLRQCYEEAPGLGAVNLGALIKDSGT